MHGKQFGESTHTALVDNLVENGQSYKDAVVAHMKTLDVWEDEAKTKPDATKIKALFATPSEALVAKFNELYWGFRKGKHEQFQGRTGDQQNDHLLLQALKDKKDVVLETTGGYWPAWIYEFASEQISDYKVIWACTAVKVAGDTGLVARNSGRTAAGMIEFLGDPTKVGAPRLPKIDKQTLQGANDAEVNTASTAMSCLTEDPHNDDDYARRCGGRPDQVYIEDNNGPKGSEKEIANLPQTATEADKTAALAALRAAAGASTTGATGGSFLARGKGKYLALAPLPRK